MMFLTYLVNLQTLVLKKCTEGLDDFSHRHLSNTFNFLIIFAA